MVIVSCHSVLNATHSFNVFLFFKTVFEPPNLFFSPSLIDLIISNVFVLIYRSKVS